MFSFKREDIGMPETFGPVPYYNDDRQKTLTKAIELGMITVKPTEKADLYEYKLTLIGFAQWTMEKRR